MAQELRYTQEQQQKLTQEQQQRLNMQQVMMMRLLEMPITQLEQIMSKVTELTNEYKERVNSKKIEDKSNFSTQYH